MTDRIKGESPENGANIIRYAVRIAISMGWPENKQIAQVLAKLDVRVGEGLVYDAHSFGNPDLINQVGKELLKLQSTE